MPRNDADRAAQRALRDAERDRVDAAKRAKAEALSRFNRTLTAMHDEIPVVLGLLSERGWPNPQTVRVFREFWIPLWGQVDLPPDLRAAWVIESHTIDMGHEKGMRETTTLLLSDGRIVDGNYQANGYINYARVISDDGLSRART